MVELEDWDNRVSKQLSIPASILPVTFVLVSYDKRLNKAILRTDSSDVLLLEGVLYLIRLTALLGEKKKKAQLVGLIIKNKLVLWKKDIPESIIGGYER